MFLLCFSVTLLFRSQLCSEVFFFLFIALTDPPRSNRCSPPPDRYVEPAATFSHWPFWRKSPLAAVSFKVQQILVCFSCAVQTELFARSSAEASCTRLAMSMSPLLCRPVGYW
jgi:hypothetical protein